MFKNKKILWISLIVLALVLAVGGYYVYTIFFQPTEDESAETPQVQTAVARQGGSDRLCQRSRIGGSGYRVWGRIR